MHLPCSSRRHGLSPENIVGVRAIENVVLLLFTPQKLGNTGHEKSGHEMAKQLAMDTLVDRWPAKNVPNPRQSQALSPFIQRLCNSGGYLVPDYPGENRGSG